MSYEFIPMCGHAFHGKKEPVMTVTSDYFGFRMSGLATVRMQEIFGAEIYDIQIEFSVCGLAMAFRPVRPLRPKMRPQIKVGNKEIVNKYRQLMGKHVTVSYVHELKIGDGCLYFEFPSDGFEPAEKTVIS